jgi:2,3-bisphosphoglycerate-independent phosphoglycerate mutase
LSMVPAIRLDPQVWPVAGCGYHRSWQLLIVAALGRSSGLLEPNDVARYTYRVVKHCVVIIDGAADRPLPERGGKTCLELANIPNLDRMAREGVVGTVRTIPEGMEPSSACACMSILGYNPRMYYRGRSAIEAVSVGVPASKGDVLFRCNLIAVEDGRMRDYSAGHISDGDSHVLIESIQGEIGSEGVRFYPGVGYRHICRISGHPETLQAMCTPPHDIPGRTIDEYLPRGEGSGLLRDLMARSVSVLQDHAVNRARESRGEVAANMIWLFWGSGQVPKLPRFKALYRLDAAMTSGVDLLRGLAKMTGIANLDIPGVTDGLDNDYAAQAAGALAALQRHDIVFIHIEAPDEAGHAGHIGDKVEAIERIDRQVLGPLLTVQGGNLRVLALPDHATPIEVRTHTPEPVPFVLWGEGFVASGARAFSEAEARGAGMTIEDGHTSMSKLIRA